MSHHISCICLRCRITVPLTTSCADHLSLRSPSDTSSVWIPSSLMCALTSLHFPVVKISTRLRNSLVYSGLDCLSWATRDLFISHFALEMLESPTRFSPKTATGAPITPCTSWNPFSPTECKETRHARLSLQPRNPRPQINEMILIHRMQNKALLTCEDHIDHSPVCTFAGHIKELHLIRSSILLLKFVQLQSPVFKKCQPVGIALIHILFPSKKIDVVFSQCYVRDVVQLLYAEREEYSFSLELMNCRLWISIHCNKQNKFSEITEWNMCAIIIKDTFK